MNYKIIIGVTSWFIISFYSLQFQDIDGNTISMSNFQGKKVLLVNIATGSNKVAQLNGLQQLDEQYGDSLVIIAFPSNSFGHESRSNAEIKEFCQANYHSTFILAAKTNVKDSLINPLFSWLADTSKNGSMEGEVINDFQKFLISKSGKLVAVMSPKLVPTDSTVIRTLNRNYQ